ncbi:hypothetical protein ET524_10210 [Senegalimassilia faecalis]|uniref:Tetratricopeptide repeat protein n=1 Tax=Senegalimassilia faecalis TaxID=2509433 RepID=A0A4Q2K381_9ACTN|nr:hypothetical protein [Senegalimassilia faecalis]RXZ54810.1 hypothetical protein ET524_10210 [Senegalimassilia faecalis]
MAFSLFRKKEKPQKTNQELRSELNELLAQQRWQEAESIADDLVSRGDYGCWYFKAQAHSQINAKEAVPMMEKAIEHLDSSRNDFYLMHSLYKRALAGMCCEAGYYDRSIHLFDAFLRPDSSALFLSFADLDDYDFFLYVLAVRNRIAELREDGRKDEAESLKQTVFGNWNKYLDNDEIKRGVYDEHVNKLVREILDDVPPEESNYC